MKILYLIDQKIEDGYTSGIIHKVKDKVSYWDEKGCEVNILSLYDFRIYSSELEILDESRAYNISSHGRYFTLFRLIYSTILLFRFNSAQYDLVYMRQRLYVPFFRFIFTKVPFVVELNTNDISEYLFMPKVVQWYNRLTRALFYKRAEGFVSVTKELGRFYDNFGKRTAVIANGINVESYRFLPEAMNDKPKACFVGSPGFPWHGLDKIEFLASKLQNIDFHIYGIDGTNSKNLFYYGYLPVKELEKEIMDSDVALCTLSLHCKEMSEASPLKSRQYLAQGLPIIYAYDDTDLKGTEAFTLKIPNNENNVKTHVAEIESFILKCRKTPSLRKETREFALNIIDKNLKEEKRLEFLQDINREYTPEENDNNVFIKDFSKFFSGALFAQLLGFFMSPLLSRIYAPEDFGMFTLFFQIVAPALILGGGSLFLLLPNIKDDRTSKYSFQIALSLTLVIALIITSAGALGGGKIIYLDHVWPFIGIAIVLSNLRAFFHFQSLADKELVYNSKSKAFESIVGSASNVSLGYMLHSYMGLVWGNFLGQIYFIYSFLRKYKVKIKSYLEFDRLKDYIVFIKEHKKHLVFQSSNTLLEYLFILAFSVMITTLSSIQDLGYFAFCYKIINTPLNLLAEYFGQAVLVRLSDFEIEKDRRSFIYKSASLLFGVSVIVVSIFYFQGAYIFKTIFGENWLRSGLISEIYVLAITSTFFIKSFQYAPNIKKRHEVYTLFSFLTFGIPILILTSSSVMDFGFLFTLKLISAVLLLIAFTYFIVLTRLFSSKD